MKIENSSDDMFYMIRTNKPGNQTKADRAEMTPFSREMLERMRQGDLACGMLQKGELAAGYGAYSTSFRPSDAGGSMTAQNGGETQELDVAAYTRSDLEHYLDRLLMEKAVSRP